MKCKNCWKEFYNPFINSKYCSKECENKVSEPTWVVKDLFDLMNKKNV
jgi:hypothetical protein